MSYVGPTIGSVHDHIHQGRGFVSSRDSGNIADAATDEILVQVGSTEMHMTVSIGTTGAFLLEIFEGPTVSSAGTSLNADNKNRTSSKTSNATLTHTPTTSADGDLHETLLAPGGKHVGGAEGMGENDQNVFAPNTDYLIRAANISGGQARAVVRLSWYETTLDV